MFRACIITSSWRNPEGAAAIRTGSPQRYAPRDDGELYAPRDDGGLYTSRDNGRSL